MKIQILPRYTAAAASSRLRAYKLAAAVNRLGLAECFVGPNDLADVCKPDIVYMQKLNAADIVREHPRAIYDFDDIWPPALLREIAASVRLFTVDTSGHGLLAPGTWKILPDMIDYDPVAPWPAADPSDLCWFGNFPNYASAAALMTSASEYCSPVTISDGEISEFPNVAWSYQDFPDSLRSGGTALLSHRSADAGKSANKMIAAITLGVPCIVNESPAYEAMARVTGLDWAIVRDARELRDAWTRLQDRGERARYLAAAQPWIWEHYRPEAIANRFMQIVEGLN